jgi:hypothetical protein
VQRTTKPGTVSSLVLTLFVIATAFSPEYVGATDVLDVVQQMRAALEPGRDRRAALTIDVVNERGEQVRWSGHVYRMHGEPSRQKIVLEHPADLRGVTVTAVRRPGRLDLMRIHLPSIRRTREILKDIRGESFLWTDFNNEDIGLERLDYVRQTLDGTERVADRPCHRLVSIPQASWYYGRIVRYVDRRTHLPIRTEYFDPAGTLFKVRTLERIETIGGHPTPLRVVMEVPPADTRTVLSLSEVEYDVGLKADLFDADP